jgi:hypothetical protein
MDADTANSRKLSAAEQGSILAPEMTKKSAPVKATGGGGYTFADKVAAGFLAQMLKRKFPLEPELGVIAELHFETRDIGHVLDDLMLVLKRGFDVANCFVSVKSNRQVTKEGFNKEFVQDAWREWKGRSGSGFDQSKDILGLIVGQIDEPTLQEWQALQKEASSTTPQRLAARLQSDSKSSNKIQRTIFEGLRQSADGEMPIETARLAARVSCGAWVEMRSRSARRRPKEKWGGI